MRLWSIHPKYLDVKGLLAVWREGLLAKKVLEGKTKGYKNHPQLDRFKKSKDPLLAINSYLHKVCEEALSRGYNFDKNKLNYKFQNHFLEVTSGQIEYEFKHLLSKLKIRDSNKYNEFKIVKEIEVHPIFKKRKGLIENWEIIKK